MPVLTDVHEVAQVIASSTRWCDIAKFPRFYAGRPNLLVAAARTGRYVNVKKGQFLAPWDMKNVVEKITGSEKEQVILTEARNTPSAQLRWSWICEASPSSVRWACP